MGVGFYAGFIQAGVGFLFLAALVLLGGLDLVRANAVKVLAVFGLTVPVLAWFWWHDLVRWGPGLALAIGSGAGGWLGTRATLAGGPRFVRVAMLLIVVVSAVALLASGCTRVGAP